MPAWRSLSLVAGANGVPPCAGAVVSSPPAAGSPGFDPQGGELAALRVTALDLLAGTVDDSESMMEVGGQLFAGPTKPGRPRTLTLPRFLAEMLREHIGGYP
jgi:hypothetical protein